MHAWPSSDDVRIAWMRGAKTNDPSSFEVGVVCVNIEFRAKLCARCTHARSERITFGRPPKTRRKFAAATWLRRQRGLQLPRRLRQPPAWGTVVPLLSPMAERGAEHTTAPCLSSRGIVCVRVWGPIRPVRLAQPELPKSACFHAFAAMSL